MLDPRFVGLPWSAIVHGWLLCRCCHVFILWRIWIHAIYRRFSLGSKQWQSTNWEEPDLQCPSGEWTWLSVFRQHLLQPLVLLSSPWCCGSTGPLLLPLFYFYFFFWNGCAVILVSCDDSVGIRWKLQCIHFTMLRFKRLFHCLLDGSFIWCKDGHSAMVLSWEGSFVLDGIAWDPKIPIKLYLTSVVFYYPFLFLENSFRGYFHA